jgi:phosphatidylglycerophosphate synthase
MDTINQIILRFRNKKSVKQYEKKLKPFSHILILWGISPNLITTVSILFGLFVAYFIITEKFIIAGVFLMLTGLAALLDGTVAREGQMVTKFGKFYNSLADVVIDSIIMLSIIVYYYYVAENFPIIFASFLLFIAIFITNHISMLMQILKTKPIEGLFQRPEFIAFIAVGLILDQLNLMIIICTTFYFITIYQLLNSIIKQIFTSGFSVKSKEIINRLKKEKLMIKNKEKQVIKESNKNKPKDNNKKKNNKNKKKNNRKGFFNFR